MTRKTGSIHFRGLLLAIIVVGLGSASCAVESAQGTPEGAEPTATVGIAATCGGGPTCYINCTAQVKCSTCGCTMTLNEPLSPTPASSQSKCDQLAAAATPLICPPLQALLGLNCSAPVAGSASCSCSGIFDNSIPC
jgi:hypothetical protein